MVANVSAVVPGSTFAWSSTPSNVSPETPRHTDDREGGVQEVV
jgi:hypothetical protein